MELYFKGDFGQIALAIGLDVSMLDYQKVVYLALVFYRQVQVYSYFWSVDVIDLAIVAYCGHKWNPVPFTNYSVPNVIGVFVTYAIEIIRLVAHVNSVVVGAVDSLHKQSQTIRHSRYNFP
jgi:hypothetical protein